MFCFTWIVLIQSWPRCSNDHVIRVPGSHFNLSVWSDGTFPRLLWSTKYFNKIFNIQNKKISNICKHFELVTLVGPNYILCKLYKFEFQLKSKLKVFFILFIVFLHLNLQFIHYKLWFLWLVNLILGPEVYTKYFVWVWFLWASDYIYEWINLYIIYIL